ncbi:MAG: HD domain-containing protein [Firmicutes bacterium]|nr:HD domain-containing protein [Bacillota bacterium]
MNMAKVRKILKNNTGKDLYQHSLGVEKTAFSLALKHGADSKKASKAGLLHDYAKNFSFEELRSIALENDLADEVALQEPALLHAPVGAWLLETELGITDKEILEAVRMHTTGAAGMSLLAKIVYLADFIEPGRTHAGVKKIRKTAFSDLEKALLCAVGFTLGRLLDRKKIIHPNSVFFYNSLVSKTRSGDI